MIYDLARELIKELDSDGIIDMVEKYDEYQKILFDATKEAVQTTPDGLNPAKVAIPGVLMIATTAEAIVQLSNGEYK
jgi:hypothetical protein